MSSNLKKSYSEILMILDLLDYEYTSKVPNKFITFLKSEKDADYVPKINPNIPLEEQNLLDDTINILAMLKLDYWCDSEDEKKELLNLLEKNEQDYQKELYEKYNPDSLFKNKKQNSNYSINSETTSLALVKEKNFILRLFNKIQQMFNFKK